LGHLPLTADGQRKADFLAELKQHDTELELTNTSPSNEILHRLCTNARGLDFEEHPRVHQYLHKLLVKTKTLLIDRRSSSCWPGNKSENWCVIAEHSEPLTHSVRVFTNVRAVWFADSPGLLEPAWASDASYSDLFKILPFDFETANRVVSQFINSHDANTIEIWTTAREQISLDKVYENLMMLALHSKRFALAYAFLLHGPMHAVSVQRVLRYCMIETTMEEQFVDWIESFLCHKIRPNQLKDVLTYEFIRDLFRYVNGRKWILRLAGPDMEQLPVNWGQILSDLVKNVRRWLLKEASKAQWFHRTIYERESFYAAILPLFKFRNAYKSAVTYRTNYKREITENLEPFVANDLIQVIIQYCAVKYKTDMQQVTITINRMQWELFHVNELRFPSSWGWDELANYDLCITSTR
jgi:hypothetical protein